MLGASFSHNAAFSQALTKRSLSLCQKTGLDVHLVGSSEQRGESFGERFVHALQDTFDKGYDSIIAIGNDTPDLSLQDLEKSQVALSENKMVLGPSLDGGVYLIGISREHFEEAVLRDIRWESSSVFTQLREYAGDHSPSLALLQQKRDLDSVSDSISFFRSGNINTCLSSFAGRIKEEDEPSSYFLDIFSSQHMVLASPQRAPPSRD